MLSSKQNICNLIDQRRQNILHIWWLHNFRAIWLAVGPRLLCFSHMHILFSLNHHLRSHHWWVQELTLFILYILCIDDKGIIDLIVWSIKKYDIFFSFFNFLWIFHSAKALGSVFQRKLEELKIYLPYFLWVDKSWYW